MSKSNLLYALAALLTPVATTVVTTVVFSAIGRKRRKARRALLVKILKERTIGSVHTPESFGIKEALAEFDGPSNYAATRQGKDLNNENTHQTLGELHLTEELAAPAGKRHHAS